RVTEELTARQPLDGLWHCLHGSNGRSDEHSENDGPTWPISSLDGEGDGPSDEPSIPLSLTPVVTSPFLYKGDGEIDGPSGM
ncbi:hypothetical protein HAX54_049018, partial [Datura stramonium]|nr:hypothetical protein [Datura stramonium]